VREIGRISNKGILIVTHGKPANRCELFNRALSSFGEWDEKYFECELSLQSQFINIVRSSYPGQSLGAVMKDPAKLAHCLKEVADYKDKNQVSDKALRQSHCWIYFYHRIE
jgi:hypothetical protein